LVYGRCLKRYQWRQCWHQATLAAGTIMQATKLPFTTWFPAFHLIGQALAASPRSGGLATLPAAKQNPEGHGGPGIREQHSDRYGHLPERGRPSDSRQDHAVDWAKMQLAPSRSVLSDGHGLRAVTTANGQGLLLHPLHERGSEGLGDLSVIK